MTRGVVCVCVHVHVAYKRLLYVQFGFHACVRVEVLGSRSATLHTRQQAMLPTSRRCCVASTVAKALLPPGSNLFVDQRATVFPNSQ